MNSFKRKPATKRLFTGLVGFPPEPAPAAPSTPVPPIEKSKRGRKRKYASDAAKQSAYRERTKLEEAQEATESLIAQILNDNKDNKGRNRGETSGEYRSAKLESVRGARDRANRFGPEPDAFDLGFTKFNYEKPTEGNRADEIREVRPTGHGAYTDEDDTIESADARAGKTLQRQRQASWSPAISKNSDHKRRGHGRDFDEGYRDFVREKIASELVDRHFEKIERMGQPEFLCACGLQLDTYKDAADHLATHDVVIENLTDLFLECDRKHKASLKRRKKPKCPLSIHVARADRCRQAGENAKVYCGECGKLIYTPKDDPANTLPESRYDTHNVDNASQCLKKEFTSISCLLRICIPPHMVILLSKLQVAEMSCG